ncbi:MAG: serine hydrolase, partial [Acidobacteriota bacterium]
AISVLVIFYLASRNTEIQLSSSSSKQVQPPPPPPPPTTPIHDVQLESIISSWAKSHPSNSWSAAVYGLKNDRRYAEYKPDQIFYSASIYKLLLMYPLFQNRTLAQSRDTNVSAAGVSRNLLDCVSLMIRVSDNPCGHAVGSLVGWSRADTELSELGLRNTELSFPAGSKTSAGDTALYLKALYNSRLFSEDIKNYIIDLMHKGTWRSGIPAGCASCSVANKTGDLGVRHDAAIVEYSNKAYVLVIFTDGASYAQIAQLTTQIQAHMAKQ